jgi:hypothetical protein
MISPHAKWFKLMAGVVANLSLACVVAARAQAQKIEVAANTLPADTLSDCGDALADALQQDSVDRPCWANIRPGDRPNPINLVGQGVITGNRTFGDDEAEPAPAFTFALAATGGTNFATGANGQTYGGLGAMSGLIARRRWQLMLEDGGGLGDFQLNSVNGANRVYLNRAALRGLGQMSARWSWHASAANTYGNDTFRTFAPLDYTTVGNAEAPVPDTVAFGVHSGNMTHEQEEGGLRYVSSRRTNVDISATHTLQYFSDDGVMVQTVGGRAEYVHSLSRTVAVGAYGNAAHQTGVFDCSLGGAGVQGLMQWGDHASVNISGGISGVSAACGKSPQFLGDASLYVPLRQRVDFYVTASRDLSAGIVEQTALLNSFGAGAKYAFTPSSSIRLTGAALYGLNPRTNQSYQGNFSELAVAYRLGPWFYQDIAVRHFDVHGGSALGLPASAQISDHQSLVAVTFWWSPNQHRPNLLSRR